LEIPNFLFAELLLQMIEIFQSYKKRTFLSLANFKLHITKSKTKNMTGQK